MKEIWLDMQLRATEFAVVSVPLGLEGETSGFILEMFLSLWLSQMDFTKMASLSRINKRELLNRSSVVQLSQVNFPPLFFF